MYLVLCNSLLERRNRKGMKEKKGDELIRGKAGKESLMETQRKGRAGRHSDAK